MGAGPELRQMAADPLYPVVVRATALALLANYPGAGTEQALPELLRADSRWCDDTEPGDGDPAASR